MSWDKIFWNSAYLKSAGLHLRISHLLPVPVWPETAQTAFYFSVLVHRPDSRLLYEPETSSIRPADAGETARTHSLSSEW